MTSVTEIVLLNGERLRVEGDPKDVEQAILAAARGSILELAWMVESETAESIAVNPEYVMMLRAPAGATP